MVLGKGIQDWQNFNRFIKKKRGRTQINKIKNERGEVTAETKEIQSIVRKYDKTLHAKNLDNLDEMDKFLETYCTIF